MNKKILLLIGIILLILIPVWLFLNRSELDKVPAYNFSVQSSDETPYTPEVITASGRAVVPVNFLNDDESSMFNAVLEKDSLVVRVEPSSIYVEKGEFGSFNLIIAEEDSENDVYFNSLLISSDIRTIKIPIIIGIESSRALLDYDVSIDFNPSSDISIVSSSQEIVVSPKLDVYKLNYNARDSNGVVLRFFIYSIDGKLLDSSEEVLSVSRQSAFDIFPILE